MEAHGSTGQSPQWALVPMEEEGEEVGVLCVLDWLSWLSA